MNRPLWAADIAEVDAALAARLIGEQFNALRTASVEPFGLGWDNAAFLVDARIVFRFPRRRVATKLIEREIAVVALIAPHVPLPISAPRYVGAPTGAYPWVFAGYDVVPGSTACSVSLSGEARAALAEPLGVFLRALHAIDTAPLVSAGLPPDEIGRLDPDKRLRLVRERLPNLVAAGVDGADLQRFVRWLETHPAPPIDVAQRRVVHGDFYPRHLLLDAGAHPSGVIDWGDVHLGDPALDLAIAHLMLPGSAHDAFRAAYGPIDERTWSAARYRATYFAFVVLDYGIREDDAGMRAIGMTAFDLLRGVL